jgi:hypothetical protein
MDHELQQYVQSYTASSDRVRHLILISAVASILALVAFRNSLTIDSLPSNWLDARAEKARIAVRNKLWNDPESRLKICYERGPEAARFVDSCSEVAENVGWVIGRRHGKDSLKAHLEKLEQLRVERNMLVSVPWLGIYFDINDLGAFSAISLALLSMTLCFSMARQHENLYLCLWKVRRIADREKRDDDGESQANILYHALAMAQVFTRPPTLARWRPRHGGGWAIRFLLVVPLAIQLLIFVSNIQSLPTALSFSPRAIIFSMSVQVLFLLPLIFCTFACFAYSRGSDIRWRDTFFTINPSLRLCTHASWPDWVKLGESPQWGFVHDGEGSLYIEKSFDCAHPLEPEPAWKAWKISIAGENLTQLMHLSEIPRHVRKVVDDVGNEYRFQPSTTDRDISILVRVTKEGTDQPLAGGKKKVIDGVGPQAGFWRPRILVRDAEHRVLYAIDGDCVRQIDPENGEVKTLGGNPLSPKPRPLWPRLLGLAIDGEQLLVADYDHACVLALQLDGKNTREVWQARGRWSPAGVAARDGWVYILEHRAPTLVGALLGNLNYWARVWSIPKADFYSEKQEKGRLLFKISRRRVTFT